jgi:predicted dehydrogenase
MLSVAQIGVGYWGPGLLRNLMASTRCNVRTVVDLSPERRNYVSRLYPGIQVTDSVESVLNDPDVSAVVIATPVATHFDLAVSALKAGKHILVEKPLATSVADVEEIATLSEGNHLVAMVGHTFLYSAPVRRIKHLIDSGELGDVRYIYSQRLNLGRIRSDVDALWNFAPHDISIIQYWLNDPTPVSVVRRGGDYIQDSIDDVVFLNILYANKIMANIHVSWLDPRRIRTMTLVGSRKMLVYDDTAECQIAIHDKGITSSLQSPPSFTYRSGDVLLPRIDSAEPLRVEIDHFLDCILDGAHCLTGPAHARKVVQILSSPQSH